MAPVSRRRRSALHRALAVAVGALAAALAGVALGDAAQSTNRAGAVEAASRATVFIRVIGDVEVVVPASASAPFERTVRRSNIELSTGSGVLVSPYGQVLTCQHVVAGGERPIQVGGVQAKATLKVKRIEVLVAPVPGGGAPERYDANIAAASQALDVAVLTISGAGLPSADLGDSDALEAGDGLDALGFPFGREVDIAKEASDDLPAPEVTVSHGDFSAFRSDEQGTRRYIQTSAAVNPGSSGGPILDADGFVVGLVSRRLTGTSAGVGFAVPINLVKDFLESNGLDSQLASRRLSLGPVLTFQGKGVRMRVPWGTTDSSPLRARVDSGVLAAAPILRVDRILTPWDALKLADTVANGQGLEAFTPLAPPVQRTRVVGGRRLVIGRTSGTLADGGLIRVEYAVLDLGPEKLVARYSGAPALVAYNSSVFRSALQSLEGDELRRRTPGSELPAAWGRPAPGVGSVLQAVVFPAGWTQEPLPPLPCPGVAPSTDAVAASALNDFALTLRAGVSNQPGKSMADLAAACGTPSPSDEGDYRGTATWMGAGLSVAGRFLALSDGQVLHLQAVAPVDQRAEAQALFTAWLARLRDVPR